MQPVTAHATGAIHPDDPGSVGRACAGDVEAFDAIVADRLPGAFRLAAAILGGEAEAADATQNALLAVWRQLPQLRDLDRFDEWLDRILINECRMRVRQQTQRREVEVVGDASTIDTTNFDQVEVMYLLEGAFEALDADDRTMVVLHLLERRPLDEIAAITHMSVGTVEWRLHEARTVLRGASTEQVRQMLERRAQVPPPDWLLPNVGQLVRATSQARPGARWWWLPRRRSERLVLVAAAVSLLLALFLGALVAGGVVDRTPRLPLPADVVVPSPSGFGASSVPSASVSPSGTAPSAGKVRTTSPGTSVASAWTLPTGWRYELVCEFDLEGSPCSLHLYDETGRDQDGWPVEITGNCDGSDVAVGPEGSAFVACTHKGRALVSGLDRRGIALPGWPVTLKGVVARSRWNDFAYALGWQKVAVGPDATVNVATAPKGGRTYTIHALAPDGEERRGWPVALDGDAQGFAVAPNGRIVAWWYEGFAEAIQFEARRTVFTQLGPDGRVLSGWPKGSVGAASGPIVREDGSIVYVSASGKVWGHHPNGEIIDGWPYQLKQPVAPIRREDGTFMFIEDSRVVVLDRHGDAVHGWPYRTKGSFSSFGCDTGGFSYPLAVTADDGTLYLASWDGARSTLMALGADGAAKDWWPYLVAVGWRVGDLHLAPDGTLEAFVSADVCGGGLQTATIRLTSHGTLLSDGLPMRLTQVYEAMRLEGLRTSSGNDTFVQGAPIDFEVELVNRSSGPVTLPEVAYDDDKSGYAAGSLQTWIKRLTDSEPLDCLDGAELGNGWYDTSGERIVYQDPASIPPGGTLPTIEVSLSPSITGCLPPGEYRYRTTYVRLGFEEDEAIDAATLDFTITARGPVVTPSPSPTPHPRFLPSQPAPTPPQAGATTPSPS